MSRQFLPGALLSFISAALIGFACAPAPGAVLDGPSPDYAGQFCDGPADCYPDVPHSEIRGEVVCTTKVSGGYCTHTCESDLDCCAVPGECFTDYPQVCSPFENDKTKRCFLSCELGDIGDYDDPNLFCREQINADWGCASSGGGSENRDICKPN